MIPALLAEVWPESFGLAQDKPCLSGCHIIGFDLHGFMENFNGAKWGSTTVLARAGTLHANATYRQVYGAADRKKPGKNLRFMWQPDRQAFFSKVE